MICKEYNYEKEYKSVTHFKIWLLIPRRKKRACTPHAQAEDRHRRQGVYMMQDRPLPDKKIYFTLIHTCTRFSMNSPPKRVGVREGMHRVLKGAKAHLNLPRWLGGPRPQPTSQGGGSFLLFPHDEFCFTKSMYTVGGRKSKLRPLGLCVK